jgi:hypothetical protein
MQTFKYPKHEVTQYILSITVSLIWELKVPIIASSFVNAKNENLIRFSTKLSMSVQFLSLVHQYYKKSNNFALSNSLIIKCVNNDFYNIFVQGK